MAADPVRELELSHDGPIPPIAAYNARYGAGAWQLARLAESMMWARRGSRSAAILCRQAERKSPRWCRYLAQASLAAGEWRTLRRQYRKMFAAVHAAQERKAA